MRTNNPALNERVYDQAGHATGTGAMTINGTVLKTGFLTLLLVAAGAWSWNQITGNTAPAWFGPALKFGWILPLLTALVIGFVPRTAPWLSPVYAVTKGVILGIISAYFENLYNGIVFTSVLLTLGVLFAILGAYLTGVLRATPMFRKIVIGATLGVALFYLAAWGLSMFGIQIPGLFGNGLVGIGFSLFVVVLAAMNLVMDFDFIEQGAAVQAPKYMEWYGAFGLLVTLVWLYIEILRLLAKLRSRD